MFLSNGMVSCLNDKRQFTITLMLLCVLLPLAKDSESARGIENPTRLFLILTFDPTSNKEIAIISL